MDSHNNSKIADTTYISQFYEIPQLTAEIVKVNELLDKLPEYNIQIQTSKWFVFNRNCISTPILVDSQPLKQEYAVLRENDKEIHITQQKLLIHPSIKTKKVTVNLKDYTDFLTERGIIPKESHQSDFQEIDIPKYQEIILQSNQKAEIFKRFNTPLKNLYLLNTSGKIDALYIIRRTIENELMEQLDPDLKHHVLNDTIPELQKIFIKRLELLYEVLAQKL